MITTTVEEKVKNFFEKEIKTKNLKLYNEAGLQYELALYLRHELEGATILLEYPVTSEFTAELDSDYEKKTKFVKKEIDLFIEHGGERVVIELKFPRSDAGFPGVIYNAAKDVKFGDQIMKSGRANSFITIFITDHKSVFKRKNTNHIYELFNSTDHPYPCIKLIKIDDTYPKFMQDRKEGRYKPIELEKKFDIIWKDLDHDEVAFKYYIISSDSNQTSCK
jgi:hypothetical protein